MVVSFECLEIFNQCVFEAVSGEKGMSETEYCSKWFPIPGGNSGFFLSGVSGLKGEEISDCLVSK